MTNELVLPVARKLQPLLGDIVFLGGSVVELLITDPAAPSIRPTKDVDFIVSLTSRLEYNRLGERLRDLGFREDVESGVICRWRDDEHIIDAMPTSEKILGFSNLWYKTAFKTAISLQLQELTIKVIRAPEFVATKLSAFRSRGGGDIRGSHDLEDILLVIDGREELLEEVGDSDPDLRNFLRQEFTTLLKDRDFVELVEGLTDRSRTDVLLGRIAELCQ